MQQDLKGHKIGHFRLIKSVKGFWHFGFPVLAKIITFNTLI